MGGCGNSRLAEEMFDDGFERIISIDFSANVVKMMNDKCRHKRDDFYYKKMDAKALEFEDGIFDCVIDKGTLDCIYCGENSVNNINKTLSEIHRVLNNRGCFISITHGKPDTRKHLLENPDFGWKVDIQTF